MAHTDDPVADRSAQLEAAYAVYTLGLDRIQDERKARDDASAAKQTADEAELFTEWQARVAQINGTGPGPIAPPYQPPTGAEQEAADIDESGQ